jgi:predicted secreted protein
MELTLSSRELAMLERILQEYLADLRMEIADTDAHAYRAELKRQEETIRAMLMKLEKKAEPADT